MDKYIGQEKFKMRNLKKENTSLKDLCEELKRSHDELIESHENLKEAHDSLVANASENVKLDISITCDLIDDMSCVSSSCIASMFDMSTSCDELLDIPCSSNLDASSFSMLVDTNLVEENKELKYEIKKLKKKNKRILQLKDQKREQPNICSTKLDEKPKTSKRQIGKKECNVTTSRNMNCYNCRGKGHIGKNCPNGNTSKSILFNDHYSLRKARNCIIISKVLEELLQA
ncbi:uncharacterized protein LOC133930089 [Phragmites australis]|uniref:uncharacterized protein LOC133930089 n=1 Tax=Phragmites australis TaxID=29695 RepID=UPI002D77F8E7|nr:uncharacterized protein LOC133930089 [Phragmites australis]